MHALADMSLPSARGPNASGGVGERGADSGGGCKSPVLRDERRNGTTFVRESAGCAREGGRLLNYAVVISGLLGTALSQQVAGENISRTGALYSRSARRHRCERENVWVPRIRDASQAGREEHIILFHYYYFFF